MATMFKNQSNNHATEETASPKLSPDEILTREAILKFEIGEWPDSLDHTTDLSTDGPYGIDGPKIDDIQKKWIQYNGRTEPVKAYIQGLCSVDERLEKLLHSPVQGGRRIRFVEDSEIENMPVREWLIAGILPQSGIAMLYGPPGTYKSFIAIDWALSIGYGYGWMGRPVTKGSVAYIAGEGSYGLRGRIKAWKSYHKKQGNSGVRWYDAPVPLTDKASVEELITALEEDFLENPPKLLIIDTLSRNSNGADENSNSEMAKIITAADRIQQKYGCAVLIVHHVGKDKSKGPRGASALVGNMETIISTDPTSNGVKVECLKQKDSAPFQPIHLAIHPILYGENPDDTSIVLVKSEAPEEEETPATKAGSSKESVQKMYNILLGKELTTKEWITLGMANGMGESAAFKARKELTESGKVKFKSEGRLYYIPLQGGHGSTVFDTSKDENYD